MPDVNFLSMPDDEFGNMSDNDLEKMIDSDEDSEETEDSQEASEDQETVDDSETNDAEDEGDTESESDEESEDTRESDSDADEDTDESSESDEDEEEDDTETDGSETSDLDYKSEYERLTSPFKANGKTIKIDNVDEAISLMQMGANYSKKMDEISGSMRIIKTLKNNDLLDQEKLNHLIDLSKKDPGAIAKLLQDGKVDPLDIDQEKGKTYRPTDHSVSQEQYDIEEAIDGIRGTKTFDKVIDVLGTEWDEKSRMEVRARPVILKTISNHMENGIYDVVDSYMTKEKALGRLDGIPDHEAYTIALNHLAKTGVLVPNGGAEQTAKADDDDASEAEQRLKSKKAEASKKKKRRAASTKKTGSASKQKGNKEVNYLSMSDEEFEKQEALTR